MNTKQIAEELVDEINHQLEHGMNAIERAAVIDEVETAIVKARNSGYSAGLADTNRLRAAHASEVWHPCEHCKQFGKSVQILTARSYSVGEAKDWDSAVTICDAHNAAIEKAVTATESRYAGEMAEMVLNHPRATSVEKVRAIRD